MKLSRLFNFVSIAIVCTLAVGAGAATLFPVVVDGRWGFADKSGKL
jgi:hypothetical protein